MASLESRHEFIRNTLSTYIRDDIDDNLENDDLSLNWNAPISSEGADCIRFDQHLHRTGAQSYLMAQDWRQYSVTSLPSFDYASWIFVVPIR